MPFAYESYLPTYITDLTTPLLAGEYDIQPWEGRCVAIAESGDSFQLLTGLSRLPSGLVIERHSIFGRSSLCETYAVESDGKIHGNRAGKEYMVPADPEADDSPDARSVRYWARLLLRELTQADVLDDALAYQYQGLNAVLASMVLSHEVSPALVEAARQRHTFGWTAGPR